MTRVDLLKVLFSMLSHVIYDKVLYGHVKQAHFESN